MSGKYLESPHEQNETIGDDGRSAQRARLSSYVVVVAIAVLVALTILGSVLTVGDHLMSAHPILGWAFYILLALLVAVGIVRPLVEVARRPVFSLYQLRTEQGHSRHSRCRMLVDNLVKNANVTGITKEQAAELEGYLEDGDDAADELIDFFEKHCIPAIDAQTRRCATTAFLATAISRSALVDIVTMLSICLDLVRSIVEVCGFRPTNLALARLYSRVMLSALVAGGIEDADLDDLIGSILGGGAGAKASGVILGSATGGLVSAFLTFRVGVITKNWLCAQDGPAKMSEIRRTSYHEALSMMRQRDFVREVTDYASRAAESVATSAARAASATARSAAETAAAAAANTARAAANAASGTIDVLGHILHRH